MVLESTVICVDNSDYMRNGDFLPTRLHAQQDAVNLVCYTKSRSNPENDVGLLTLANVEVLATLTTDIGIIISKLYQVQPGGVINLRTGIRIAHLVLKHRQGKNHKMRIVAFVGSPVAAEEKELVQLAKRLKKEKVNIDFVSFGEDTINNETLTTFINTVNGAEGTGSHLLTIPLGSALSEALITSPIIRGEDGTGGVSLGGSGGFEFGVDPNEDPELVLALRISMEDERQRQEDTIRRANAAATAESFAAANTIAEKSSEETLHERALATSIEEEEDFVSMTDEEQIAFAMLISLQEPQRTTVDSKKKEEPTYEETDEDYSEAINDPAFLQSVLETLPGVDPQSDEVRQAVGSLQDKKTDDNKAADRKRKCPPCPKKNNEDENKKRDKK